MPHIRPKRSNDLVFICLDEAYSYWQDADEMKVEMAKMVMFVNHPKQWTGDDIHLSTLMELINALAPKYHWNLRNEVADPGDFMVTGGEAFGIVHYAIENALTNSHNLKATQETLPIINDLQEILRSRWSYQEHKEPKVERIAYLYSWSAVMASQRVQGKQVTLDLSEQQKKKIIKTAGDVIKTYADLMPEFSMLMAESHIMSLGKGYGERLAARDLEPATAP